MDQAFCTICNGQAGVEQFTTLNAREVILTLSCGHRIRVEQKEKS